jgi:hypothetical protein
MTVIFVFIVNLIRMCKISIFYLWVWSPFWFVLVSCCTQIWEFSSSSCLPVLIFLFSPRTNKNWDSDPIVLSFACMPRRISLPAPDPSGDFHFPLWASFSANRFSFLAVGFYPAGSTGQSSPNFCLFTPVLVHILLKRVVGGDNPDFCSAR